MANGFVLNGFDNGEVYASDDFEEEARYDEIHLVIHVEMAL